MSSVVFVNAINISPYAFEPLAEGRCSAGMVIEKAAAFPAIEKKVILTDDEKWVQRLRSDYLSGDEGGGWEIRQRDEWSLSALLETMSQDSVDCEDIFYCFLDTPLIDDDLCRRMYDNHCRYFAEYTFADGYPVGLSPEILRRRILPALQKLAESISEPLGRQSLFRVVEKDINAFDIETELAPRDLRLMRVELACDNKRNYQLTQAVYQAGGLNESEVLRILQTRPEIIRTIPAFFEFQITAGTLQQPSYLPPEAVPDGKGDPEEMSQKDFRFMMDKIAAWSEDGVVSLSHFCEPSLHKRLANLVGDVLDHQGFRVLLETSGLGWQNDVLRQLEQMDRRRFLWILDLDALDPELYRRIRGAGYEEAMEFADYLLTEWPDQTWLQAVRMKENEEHLLNFYQKWKEKSDQIIIQKYDWFCGVLPQRKVTDLSPLKRFPCWRLRRDWVIGVDGTVPLCREDLGRREVMGNLLQDDVETIQKRGDEIYRAHTRGDYPALCRECDEYYTYNF